MLPFDEKITLNSNFSLKIIEREHQRIAAELHDNVSSKLTVIQHKLYLQPNSVQEIITLLDQVIHGLRNISHGLFCPFTNKLGFVEAIQDFIRPLHDVLNVEFQILHLVQQDLDDNVKLQLFRIFQEVVNNVLKHAKATRLLICLHISKKNIHLIVQDNGIGFINSYENYGLGMKSIALRANELKAIYKFKSGQNRGTVFIISTKVNELNIKSL